jgi:hypothetical protein
MDLVEIKLHIIRPGLTDRQAQPLTFRLERIFKRQRFHAITDGKLIMGVCAIDWVPQESDEFHLWD